ncbi:hypothetical protein [Neptunicella sp. SCSIO 80796]|uniref:hypothetical protein n=1 Tax=Neptunicella plasticusilytica TaxID=3117012 RepID=UPI003A4D5C24
MAIHNTVYLNSDQGSQYSSRSFRKLLCSLVAAGAGQPEIAVPLTAIATAASISANTLNQSLESGNLTDTEINKATLAEGAGELSGKAAENGVKIAGELAGNFGVKGKAAEALINVGSEYAGQVVSNFVKNETIEDM